MITDRRRDANSRADSIRSRGFLHKHCATISRTANGTGEAATSEKATGCLETTLANVLETSHPTCGGRLYSKKNSTPPIPQMSVCGEIGPQQGSTCSGAMKAGVPASRFKSPDT